MKTANAILEITTKKKTAYFNIYIERTSDEIFSMGNSSFFINCNKLIYKNPVLIFQCKKYSSKGYEPIQLTQYTFNCISLQLRCNTPGKEICKSKTKIATVKFDLTGSAINESWRLQDSAVVTPGFETVDTKFILNFK